MNELFSGQKESSEVCRPLRSNTVGGQLDENGGANRQPPSAHHSGGQKNDRVLELSSDRPINLDGKKNSLLRG